MSSSSPSTADHHPTTPSQTILDPHHKNPFAFDPIEPLVLFIVQAVIIISLCNLIGFFFKRIRQPQVIAEVIGGIILGPTALGKIPNFTNAIFPSSSIPFLSLVANIGLILFLFIIGLEVDFKLFKQNWRSAAGIGLFGLAIPFGIGAAVGTGIYTRFVDGSQVQFSHFILFICVAFAITAFPVLCRILTELKLLKNPVGIATLAAGVANDVIGWILLALAVALVNSGAGLTALYVMLVVAGWVVFLVFVIRPIFIAIARRSGSFERGPTRGITCLVLLMVFASAWFTQILGVHAIFGGFLIGVIMPHNGGFANSLVAKIEDLVTVFFLPLYFTLSGLSTDLTKLNDGYLWAWTICVLICAQFSKFLPCFASAMWGGMDWRESGAVGSLMACKGLVELIVLNIGLKAGVLNSQVFAMFVLMAVVTTFITTPLTLFFYPESYHNRRHLDEKHSNTSSSYPSHLTPQKSSFLVVFSDLEHLPSIMSFVKLLQHSVKKEVAEPAGQLSSELVSPKESDSLHSRPAAMNTSNADSSSPRVSALRLLELSQRTSDVMKASDVDETKKHDPILKVFSTFAFLNGIPVCDMTMSIILEEEFVHEIVSQASRLSPQLVILPWYTNSDRMPHMATTSANPIEKMLSSRVQSSPQYASLVRAIFQRVECDVAVLVDSGFSLLQNSTDSMPLIQQDGKQHIMCIFIGGPDDRAGLSLVVQLAQQNPNVVASVLRVIRTAEPTDEDDPELAMTIGSTPAQQTDVLFNQMTIDNPSRHVADDTIYDTNLTSGNLQSETADNLLWRTTLEMASSNERVQVEEVQTCLPLGTIIRRVNGAGQGSGLMVVTGRSRQGGESHRIELSEYLKQRAGDKLGEPVDLAHRLGIVASSDVRKSLGDVPSGLVASQTLARIFVIQAGSQSPPINLRHDLEKSP